MHDVRELVIDLAAAARISIERIDPIAWRPMSEAPRDGRWIIGLAADRASVFRIGWGREDGAYPTWSTFEYNYGNAFFVGWIPCPQDPPSLSANRDGDTAGAPPPRTSAPAGPLSDPDPATADTAWLGG